MGTATKPLNPWKLAGYKAGQPVACTIVRAEPGGYKVTLSKDQLSGFLATSNKLKSGQEVLARYVCLHNNRILLTCSFAGTSADKKPPTSAPQWSVSTATETPAQPAAAEADAAFNVWAENASELTYKRAVDLIVPPLDPDPDSIDSFIMKDRGMEWLLTDIEGGMRTGCMRISSEKSLTRSAILLYRGRAVGCIYGDRSVGNGAPKEVCLDNALKQLEDGETQVSIYPLPETIVLPMSALFFGYPVERSDNLNTINYFDYLLNWLADKQQTACIALSFPEHYCTYLVLVHKGEFVGAFNVDKQHYADRKEPVYDLLRTEHTAGLEASILPLEIFSPAMRYGHSLSMARKEKLEL